MTDSVAAAGEKLMRSIITARLKLSHLCCTDNDRRAAEGYNDGFDNARVNRTNPEPCGMNVAEYMSELGQRARAASRLMARADTARKNAALDKMAQVLDAQPRRAGRSEPQGS